LEEEMKLKELILIADWNEVKSSLLQAYPRSEKSIGKYQSVFETLLSLNPCETRMRLYLKQVIREGTDEEPSVEVLGKDGTLNKDLPDFRYFGETASPEFANSETSFALDLVPWDEWLGTELNPSAIRAYSCSDVIAHCLWEMTFFGFEQATIDKEKKEIDRRVMDLVNMSKEEKKRELIPLEKVIGELQGYPAKLDRRPAKK
jgi:hypothetical protein